MSQMIDFTVPSTVPGRTLHAFRCVPDGQVRAIVQLSHGMVEFIDRYKPLAEYLAARGILVWATAAPSAPKPITATLPSRTATAPCWTTCTP